MLSTDYDGQAQAFLDRFGLRFRATFKGDRCPPWCGGKCCHGDRYRVTLSRRGAFSLKPKRFTFDWWNSQADMQTGNTPTAYSVLASIGSEQYCPDTFGEFVRENGYDLAENADEVLDTFRRCRRLAARMKNFFAGYELEALAEIA